MIDLNEKQDILLMHLRNGRSQRDIARKTGVDRKTIRKYIEEYEKLRGQLIDQNPNLDPAELIQAIAETPKYQVGPRPKRVLTNKMTTRIQELLDENANKKQRGLRKQLKKPIDIHQVLET